DSFFDVYFEVEVVGQVFYNAEPARLSAEIQEKPPRPGDIYMGVQSVELMDEYGNPTDIFMLTMM
ncbi:MAG: hypothetical protein GWN67_27410, partial [Phycisphaerae bacterium]|nr:hypothetical protein [Phycisphaerae bacterium]NIW96295.1 hypothetical protein [Phycisphaerae bacterium]